MITHTEVEKVANLARLNFEEAELDAFTSQLNDILNYIEQLNELDTKAVEPTFHALDITNVMREDAAGPSLPVEASLSNAPEHENDSFLVPKII
jgi:aspartyl-tRNA(Asn)/glutamyl-tRNA(Gln) amidotransferase subunit C